MAACGVSDCRSFAGTDSAILTDQNLHRHVDLTFAVLPHALHCGASVGGFGVLYGDDKAAYKAYTGRTDWPRNPVGLVNIDDITRPRSRAI
jgi:hypothetical protein